MNDVEVRICLVEEILPLRWEILRPGFPKESATFAGDDAPETFHVGAFVKGDLAGVASFYREPLPEKPELSDAWQLRGMATQPEVRGAGLGRAVLEFGEQEVRRRGGAFVWCNARVIAVGFYRRHAWETLGEQFEIPTVGPHFRMVRRWAEV